MINVIAGLGNHGIEYSKNRHNIGFMVIDAIAKEYDVTFSNKFHSKFSSFSTQSSNSIFLMKPETYMNRSGIAVLSLLNFFKLSINNVLVIHDDIDLELGKIRVKVGGGSGGHNGIKSIDNLINNEYTRLRFGIGRPNKDVHSYVLSNFSNDEEIIVIKMIDIIVKNLSLLLTGEKDSFMNICSMKSYK